MQVVSDGTGAARRSCSAQHAARPGNDLPEMSAQGAGAALRQRGGAGGGFAALAGGRADRGTAGGRVERAAKWVRRNPLVAALAAAVVLAVLVGASGIFVKYLDAKEQEGIAKEKEGIAKEQTRIAKEQEGIARRKAQETVNALIDRDAALKRARSDASAARAARHA